MQGKHYASGGFKEGDVLGCLISLPSCPSDPNYDCMSVNSLPQSSSYLFPSHKDLPLINFKHNYFYEEKDEIQNLIKDLKVASGSYVRLFSDYIILLLLLKKKKLNCYHNLSCMKVFLF